MRIAFAGTPDFAAAALRALVEAGHDVALVLTQPDRPAGRGLKLQPSAVKSLAHEHGLLLIQPRGLRLDGKYADEAEAARLALQAAAPESMVVAAYGLILPQWVLSLPPRGCLNIHASLLPRWRGAAPIHRAIEAGDAQTGITIMQMDAGLDTGDMLWVERWPIAADDTTGSLQAKLAELGARTIVDALAAPYLSRTPQPAEGVTYAHKIDKREAAIDWRASAAVLERRLRAFDPFPGAHFSLGGETVKLWRAVVCADAAPGAEPGQVIQAGASTLRVACGEGALGLLTLQCPGGRRIDSAAFLRGRALQAGDRLG